MSNLKTSLPDIKAACLEFINGLGGDDLYRLAWDGSIWISLADVRTGDVTSDSFMALGHAGDGVTKELGHGAGAVCLVDLDSFAERFVFPGFEDDEDEEVEGRELQLRAEYTPDLARAELVSVIKRDGWSCDLDLELANSDASN